MAADLVDWLDFYLVGWMGSPMVAMWAADWVDVMDISMAAQMVVGSAAMMDYQLAASMDQWTVDQTAAAMVQLRVVKKDTWMAESKVQLLVVSMVLLSVAQKAAKMVSYWVDC